MGLPMDIDSQPRYFKIGATGYFLIKQLQATVQLFTLTMFQL